MTIRLSPSVVENIWQDAQRVAQNDLKTEQNHVDQTIAAVVNNHFGSGIIPSTLTQNTLFDSDSLSSDQVALVAANIFDGTGIQVTTQPSDINLGNQIEVELSGSSVKGRKSVKVAIIGLTFDNVPHVSRFYFYKNEKQVTSRHYKKILAVFFNDFKGNLNCSRNLGGRIVIREAKSFQVSRDAVMISQDVQPDLFWRDFKVPTSFSTLSQVLQAGIGPTVTVDALDINTTGRANKSIVANDVTSQIGQKFIAKTNNIQKITLLLGVNALSGVSLSNLYNWTGDIVISVYPLQTSVSCNSDIVPNLAIDFDPAVTPLAQISFNQSTLKDAGYLLNDVLQPVDFVFSNTPIGAAGGITVGNYYAITVKRAGSANLNDIQIGVGNNKTDDTRETLFNGTWVDVQEEDLWFQVWTDAIKIADGQGYDAGNGMYFAKTAIDSTTGATIDNEKKYYSFKDTGQNIVNIAVLQATSEQSVVASNERTGNNSFSRQQFVPNLSLISSTDLSSLQSVSEPLIVGSVEDTNPKTIATIEKIQKIIGLAKGDNFCVVNPDADLLSNNLLGSKLVPNKNNLNKSYKIIKQTLCTDGYGDVNGDNVIDATDVSLVTSLIGESLYLTSTQAKIVAGTIDVLSLLRADVDGDGYITANDANLITSYVNKSIHAFPVGSSFQHLCLEVENLTGRYDGYYSCSDGYIRDGYNQSSIVPITSLDPSVLQYDGYLTTPMIESDNAFNTVPFASITYQIIFQPFWQSFMLALSSSARLVPASFTYSSGVTHGDCSQTVPDPCSDRNAITPTTDPGRTDFFVPDNLVVGTGEILRPDGTFYKNDLEIGLIELRLPATPLKEVKINIFDAFIADQGDGRTTKKGFPCMKYADCTTVQPADLVLNKIKFEAAISAYYPSLDGYSTTDGYSIIVDDIIGVWLDSSTGVLTLTLQDLAEDHVFLSLVTKISITVFLKKAGWNNKPLVVTSSQILGLISS